MHVSGGHGRQYRTTHRRDWPTGQAFPNLWPFKIKLDDWSIGGFPSDLFDGMLGTLSGAATIADDGLSIAYKWENSFLFDTATILLTEYPGTDDLKQGWVFLFTETTKAGFLRIVVDAYLLDGESDLWQVSHPLPAGHWSYDAVGEFGGFVWAGETPLIQMLAARWEDLPVDERSP